MNNIRVMVFDLEVFKYDWIFGYMWYNDNPEEREVHFIINDRAELAAKIHEWKDNVIFVGHNIEHYDLKIVQAIIEGEDPYEITDLIINEKGKYYKSAGRYLTFYDTLKQPVTIARNFLGLKTLAMLLGFSGYECEVDFNIDRPLTEDELESVLEYNTMDIYVNSIVFDKHAYFNFSSKLLFCEEFEMPLYNIRFTWGTLASKLVEFDPKIRFNKNTDMYFRDHEAIDLGKYDWIFDFLEDKANVDLKTIPQFDIQGVPHKLGVGGIHGATKSKYYDGVWFADATSYYVYLQIVYDLISRTLEDPSIVKRWADTRVKLKEEGSPMQICYKTLLVTLYGITKLEGSPFFDPEQQFNISVYGQLFLIDLADKLEDAGYSDLVQMNTDGIVIETDDISMVQEVVKDWEERTQINMEYEFYDMMFQKDVNNYVVFKCDDDFENGILTPSNCKVKGKIANKFFIDDSNFMDRTDRWLSIGLVRYLAFGTLDISDLELIDLQRVIGKAGAKYVEFEGENLGNVVRTFPAKEDTGPLCRVRVNKDGSIKKIKCGYPNNLIYNGDLKDAPDNLYNEIDYDYMYDEIEAWATEFGKE